MAPEIINFLIENGLLKKAQLKDFPPELLNNDAQLEAELLKRGLIKESDFLQAKSAVLGIPYVDLSLQAVDNSILQEIPEDAALHYHFLPIQRNGEEISIGMVNPEDVEAREALKFIALKGNFTPKIFLISVTDFNNISKQYRTFGKEVTQALEQLENELEDEELGNIDLGEEKIEQLSAEAPITKIVAVILKHAVEGHASDIHIEPLEDKTRVRFRLDGTLHSSIFLPKVTHNAVISRIKVLANLKIDETRIPQDGRFHTKINNIKVDFRISSLPTVLGEKMAIRILDPNAGLGTLAEIGYTGHNLEVYERALQKPYGIILITGPTGSGKSTTLYTTLNMVNKEGVNIITLEDPVEYYMTGVNQSQIKPEIGYTFAAGLRSILRQDPNIIMVGEIRDKETASLAIHAALTGHLVFATLHTNNALGIIPRLIDMDIDAFLIPSVLVVGAAQRLIKKLCRECMQEVEISSKFSKVIEEVLSDVSKEELAKYGIAPPFKLYRAPGCAACGLKGTKGRISICEVVAMTPELEKIILDNPSESKISPEAKRQGMITMKQDGIMKALAGLVSIEEVFRAVEE
jgi:type IV pilus assembly protein PilB